LLFYFELLIYWVNFMAKEISQSWTLCGQWKWIQIFNANSPSFILHTDKMRKVIWWYQKKKNAECTLKERKIIKMWNNDNNKEKELFERFAFFIRIRRAKWMLFDESVMRCKCTTVGKCKKKFWKKTLSKKKRPKNLGKSKKLPLTHCHFFFCSP